MADGSSINPTQKPFSTQVALVTGAGRGIGAATANLLAREGAKVALLARTRAELDAQMKEILAFGGQAMTLCGDVSDEAFVRSAFKEVHAQLGPVSILVNAAAMIRVKRFEELTLEDWERTQAVNVRGSFLCAREAFAHMRERGGGAIVNISSLGGVSGTEKFPGFTAYTASKYAVIGLTECLAVEGREFGIRVNAVAPGAVDTQMLKEAAPFLKTRTLPVDVAQVILPLCRREGVSGTIVEMHTNE